MTNPRYANGAARRKIRARIKALGEPCALCGKPIDYTLGMITTPEGKRRPHPMSYVVDEKLPVSLGGSPIDMDNCQPAHWICNAKKGNRICTTKKCVNALPQPFDDW